MIANNNIVCHQVNIDIARPMHDYIPSILKLIRRKSKDGYIYIYRGKGLYLCCANFFKDISYMYMVLNLMHVD